jgi:pilus assembly protein Flp/PilA
MRKLITRLVREDDGQDLIEYALLAALIAVALTGAITGVRTAISGQFQSVGTALGS